MTERKKKDKSRDFEIGTKKGWESDLKLNPQKHNITAQGDTLLKCIQKETPIHFVTHLPFTRDVDLGDLSARETVRGICVVMQENWLWGKKKLNRYRAIGEFQLQKTGNCIPTMLHMIYFAKSQRQFTPCGFPRLGVPNFAMHNVHAYLTPGAHKTFACDFFLSVLGGGPANISRFQPSNSTTPAPKNGGGWQPATFFASHDHSPAALWTPCH